jgi:hypothetical protein
MDRNEQIDLLEKKIVENCRLLDLRPALVHRFTPGLYAREVTIPEGSVVTSKIHRTEHLFVLSKGRLLVWNKEGDIYGEEIVAPYTGTTKPGTRRVVLALEESVWTTFHPTTLTDVEEIEKVLVEDRENPLLTHEERALIP